MCWNIVSRGLIPLDLYFKVSFWLQHGKWMEGREEGIRRAMAQEADDDGFDKNRNESRKILDIRFMESSIGMLWGNKGEEKNGDFQGSSWHKWLHVVTFTTPAHWKKNSMGSKICKSPVILLTWCCLWVAQVQRSSTKLNIEIRNSEKGLGLK